MRATATREMTTRVGGVLWIGGLAFGLLSLMRAETVAGPIGDVPDV